MEFKIAKSTISIFGENGFLFNEKMHWSKTVKNRNLTETKIFQDSNLVIP